MFVLAHLVILEWLDAQIQIQIQIEWIYEPMN